MSSDFDWVNARAACSPAKVFEQLRLQIEHDVGVRNKMAEGRGYKFTMHSEPSAFAAFLDSTMVYRNVPHRDVKFLLAGQNIIARYGDDTDIFIATLTLNADGECRLKIKDKNYELWQVRHMALEKLFFDIVAPE